MGGCVTNLAGLGLYSLFGGLAQRGVRAVLVCVFCSSLADLRKLVFFDLARSRLRSGR
jgi:hypothetical protein